MRLARVVLCLSLLAALTAPAAAAATRAKARLAGCETSLLRAERRATFEGDMRTIPRSVGLSMRFRLQVKTAPGTRWQHVQAPGWGTWLTADPGVGRYVYTKTVEELVAPGRYRAVIKFRWTDALGQVLMRRRRVTRVCAQPDLRPDLAPVTVRLRAGSRPENAIYVVEVRNAGATDAGAFEVVLENRGRRSVLGGRAGLSAGGTATIRREAPACRPGEPITVRVEQAAGAGGDRDPEDDALTLACPPVEAG